jgi:hypothetical protein
VAVTADEPEPTVWVVAMLVAGPAAAAGPVAAAGAEAGALAAAAGPGAWAVDVPRAAMRSTESSAAVWLRAMAAVCT